MGVATLERALAGSSSGSLGLGLGLGLELGPSCQQACYLVEQAATRRTRSEEPGLASHGVSAGDHQRKGKEEHEWIDAGGAAS